MQASQAYKPQSQYVQQHQQQTVSKNYESEEYRRMREEN